MSAMGQKLTWLGPREANALLGLERLSAVMAEPETKTNEFIASWRNHYSVLGGSASAPLWFVCIGREEGGMFGSLRERLERRQRLQRRIDLLVGDPASPGSNYMDADPVVSGDMEAAIAEAFHSGQNGPNFVRHRRDR